MPAGVQSTIDGTSSSESVTDLGGPPSADTIAIRALLAKNRSRPIALENAICALSGDQCGPWSGPGCETIFLMPSSASVRTYTSDVLPLIRSGFFVALKAIRRPSGDHEKPPTLKSLPFVRWRPATGALSASSTTNVQRCTC
jgi:hypothetical protein